ncbi:hypothetical protein [Microbacterium aurantiacum]|uniref:Uncharacterized protein n=1 Tax=Microbacterium aurantiacum TaxID=162393 RepID=A0ABT8FS31_9MICO|nr:hypothetical protein [Microbacterium aurantiacum]MDN4463917.1 hypothetical protein [Microbacterium aurantiacum]
MATVYPPNPLKPGETAEFSAHPEGPRRTLRAITDAHWLSDVVNGVQSEVRRVEDGFSVMTTNGNGATQTAVFPTWREAMIHGL